MDVHLLRVDSRPKESMQRPIMQVCVHVDDEELVICFVVSSNNSCLTCISGLGAKERKAVQQQWMNGEVPVIVATISFGMGVDKANVRCVCIKYQYSSEL